MFPLTLFIFDVILLSATISNRKNAAIPVSYIGVMCFRGMIENFVLVSQHFTYMIMNSVQYEACLNLMVRELTLLGTFSYLIALGINLLMSVNRVIIVIKPFNRWFTHARIFIYFGIISFFLLISLIIPFLSPCYVMGRVDKLAFVSGCAPARHPITNFQNTYAIIIPFACLFFNLSIVLHLRFKRNNFYMILWHKLRGNVQAAENLQSRNISEHSKERDRRDVVMIRQAISIAVYLSIYEFGAFMIKIFPELYIGLSPMGKDIYFYIRLESVPFLNFFIYFIETKRTRLMILNFFWERKNQNSSLVVVARHTSSGS